MANKERGGGDKEGEGEEQMRRQRAFAAETDVANFSIFIISALVFWRLPLKKKVFAKDEFPLTKVACQELCTLSSSSCSWDCVEPSFIYGLIRLRFPLSNVWKPFLWQIKHKYEVRKITISQAG